MFREDHPMQDVDVVNMFQRHQKELNYSCIHTVIPALIDLGWSAVLKYLKPELVLFKHLPTVSANMLPLAIC